MRSISLDRFANRQQVVQEELGNQKHKMCQALRCAVMHQDPTPPQHGQTALEVFLAHTVEYIIDAFWLCPADHLDKILGVIVDGRSPIFGQNMVFAG